MTKTRYWGICRTERDLVCFEPEQQREACY